MATTNVLLCCGAGMSSGFLASATEQAAAAQNLDWHVTAVSQSVALEWMPDYDAVLLGPHFANSVDEFEEVKEDIGCDTKIAVIPREIYGGVDGNSLLEFAKEVLAQ